MDFIDEDWNYLTEGLITSYPLDMLRSYVGMRKDFLDIGPVFEESSFNGLFRLNGRTEDMFVDELNRWLFKFGYFISAVKKADLKGGEIVVSIEIKYPSTVNMSKYLDDNWYHITNSQHMESIKMEGIGPRGTKTSYNHPPDRIYLIHTENVDDERLITLAKSLYKNKYDFLQRTNNSKSIKRWETTKMVLLRVTLDDTFTVYYDPVCDKSSNYIAGFTMKYIGPDRISFVKEF